MTAKKPVKSAPRKSAKKQAAKSGPSTIGEMLKKPFAKMLQKNRELKKRRPHRSFRMTKRRDYSRSLRLPGYIAFSGQVWQIILRNKGLFLRFFILYAILSVVIVGMLSQENYAALRDTLNSTGEDLGFSKWAALVTGAATGSANTSQSETQQILSVILILMGWLTIVWVLRQIMAGHKIKLRDGLYSSGSPIMATLVVIIVMAAQVLPFALALLAYSALTGVGIINSGVAIENMAAWCALAAIGALTLYWITSSFIALVIVTLPGMYPFRALKAAGDMVVGRRLRITLRLLWMVVPLLLLWAVILIPAVLADDKWQIAWLPIVPIAVLLLTIVTLIWVACYVYVLYRKVVDDDAKPAL